MSSATPSIFTPTSAFSLAGVAGVALLSYIASKALLPKNARWQDRYTFIWLVCMSRSSARPPAIDLSIQAFDALIHFSFEGSWLYLSTFGRQVITSEGPLAEMCTFPFPPLQPHQAQGMPPGKEYTRADYRWGVADPTVVSLELLTVLGAGPLCCYILKQLASDDPARHYWIIVLCTAELYGG